GHWQVMNTMAQHQRAGRLHGGRNIQMPGKRRHQCADRGNTFHGALLRRGAVEHHATRRTGGARGAREYGPQVCYHRPPGTVATAGHLSQRRTGPGVLMRRAVTLLLFASLSGPALAADDSEALLAEQRDAAQRERQELAERTDALAAQLAETQRLLKLQDAYLERLAEELARQRETADEPTE